MDMNRRTARRGGPLGRRRAEGAAVRSPALPRAAARGFTLTELLIVIGLIVLVLALAVPAFQAMTGGRSVDAAQNQLSAVLGAARAEAIGLQKVRGVFFYIDPATERVNAALVQETSSPLEAPDDPPEFYLDLVPDRDPIALPVGVGLQGIDNASIAPGTASAGGTRRDDGYVGYNPLVGLQPAPPAGGPRYGGVILFDGYGRVINKRYGFLIGREAPGGTVRSIQPTLIGALFGYSNGNVDVPEYFVPRQSVGAGNTTENNHPPRSQFGFALFDAQPFRTLGFTDADPQFDPGAGGYATPEQDEEKWIDQNGIPVLINRYNGTLVRGE